MLLLMLRAIAQYVIAGEGGNVNVPKQGALFYMFNYVKVVIDNGGTVNF